jgi:Glyoxalase-like domain
VSQREYLNTTAQSDLALDHCVVASQDLETDALLLKEMGFTLTPRSDLSAVGVANYLVLFPPQRPEVASFMEIMAAQKPLADLHPAMASVLRQPGGLRWVVLATHDCQASHAALAARGAQLPEPVHVRREWKISAEQSVWPEFDVTFPQATGLPLPFNTCQYHNVSLYHRSAWLEHANGSIAMVAALALAKEPQRIAEQYARFWGHATRQSSPGCWTVKTGASDFVVFGQEAAKRHFAGLPDQATTLEESARYLGLRFASKHMSHTRTYVEHALPTHDASHMVNTPAGFAITMPDHTQWIMEWIAS